MKILHEWKYRGTKYRLSKLDDPDMPEELSYLQEEFCETLDKWRMVPMGVFVMQEAALIQSLLARVEALEGGARASLAYIEAPSPPFVGDEATNARELKNTLRALLAKTEANP